MNKVKRLYVILSILTLLLLYLSTQIGAVKIPISVFWEVVTQGIDKSNQYLWDIWLNIRLPRVLGAMLIGGMLAFSGAIMQGLFRNPLVDPGIVGVMSGASFAATVSIVFGYTLFPTLYQKVGDYALPISAFVGGWLVTFLLYFIARRNGNINVAYMLLIGIAIAAFTGALTGLVTYLADDIQLRSITFWSMGSLAGLNWQKTIVLLIVATISLPALYRYSRALNAIMLGENIAGHIGFDIEKVKRKLIFWVALIVGSCVAFAGIIGFVGLIVPHIARAIFGTNYNFMLIATFLMGTILLLLSDLVSRTIAAPAELPIGIITAFFGAPFLAFLVWKTLRVN